MVVFCYFFVTMEQMRRWFLLPILVGAAAAWWWPVKTPSKTSSPQPIPVVPAAAIRPLSAYLVSSQQFFSRGISISQQKTGGVRRRNQEVTRLINQAITLATTAISHYPADPRGYAQRAKIYQAIQSYLPEAKQIALVDWTRAAQLAKNNSNYWHQAAHLCQQVGNLDCWVQNLQRAAELDPTNGQLLLELAQAESQAGQLQKSYQHYQQLLGMLVDDRQRSQVKQELLALGKLMAKTKGVAAVKLVTPSPLPLEMNLGTPKLEASQRQPLVIAAGEKGGTTATSRVVGNAFSGTGVIPGGEREKIIHSQRVTTGAAIYLTAIDDTDNQTLRLAQKGNGFFKVRLDHALNHDLHFKWLIVPQND